MAKVEIDPGAGFCSGVEEVIRTAESLLMKGETVYGLGEMVHNSQETKRLRDLGMKTISHSELTVIKPSRVLFRAHGEPPSTYQLAARQQIEVIDGTCPIVLKLQERIRKRYASMDHHKEQLVIFGSRNHPETIGLLGQVNGDATVVSSPGDVQQVDRSRTIHLFSQTTMDPEMFAEVEKALKEHLHEPLRIAFRSSCTVCGQMKRRKPGLRSFAMENHVVVFVSGKNSSNGKMLFEYCLSINPRSYWISEASEVDPEWFRNAESIGISGATSTSREQLESVSNLVGQMVIS